MIVLTLAGAATCGYAAVGAVELRSRHMAEMRLPVLIGNGVQRRRVTRDVGELR